MGSAWWKGRRGEWYVAVQFALFALVAFGPRSIHGWPPWPFPGGPIPRVAGGLLLLAGAALIGSGAIGLRRALTALPYPKENAPLLETGPFRFVRHPMYGGGILMASGWALWSHGWLTLVYALLLAIFVNLKASREERWLGAKFHEYESYRKRVRKLIPFLY